MKVVSMPLIVGCLYILRCLYANFPAAESAWRKTMGNKGRTRGAEGHAFQLRSVGPPETLREVHSQYGRWGAVSNLVLRVGPVL